MDTPDCRSADVRSVCLGACRDHSNHDENLVISPAEASAKIGDTIEWINKDVFAHTATARNDDWDVTLPLEKTGCHCRKHQSGQQVKSNRAMLLVDERCLQPDLVGADRTVPVASVAASREDLDAFVINSTCCDVNRRSD